MKIEKLNKANEIAEKLRKFKGQRDKFDNSRPKPTEPDEVTWPNYKVAFHAHSGYEFESIVPEFTEKTIRIYYAVLCEEIAILERKFEEL